MIQAFVIYSYGDKHCKNTKITPLLIKIQPEHSYKLAVNWIFVFELGLFHSLADV